MNPTIETKKKDSFSFKLKSRHKSVISEEEIIRQELLNIKKELDIAYHKFENATEQDLIDSCIYEMKSLQTRYEYYIKKAKEKSPSLVKEWEKSS